MADTHTPTTIVRKDGSTSQSHGRGNGSPAAPPFEAGNTAALVHGAYSEQAIAARAEQVHAALLEFLPWCADPRYSVSLRRYSQATAREQLAHEALMSAGGKVSARLLEAATSASRLAWAMADQLGLTPAGHAKLKMLAAGATEAEASIADLAAEGQAVRARRAATAIDSHAVEDEVAS